MRTNYFFRLPGWIYARKVRACPRYFIHKQRTLMENPLITYPCAWSYRLIGEDGEQIVREIPGKMGGVRHEISFANRSRQGRYVSINVDAIVSSDEERLSVASRLQRIPGVRMVM
jgi:uncharacterized protein